jgi:hypothetical protein
MYSVSPVGQSVNATPITDICQTMFPALDTISGTNGSDQITLMQETDQQHIDWTMGPQSGKLLINDPNGLTINGNGGSDSITLAYDNGNPLPNTVHLSGTFSVTGLQGANPLAGTTLDIGRSTVYVEYGGSSDPINAIRGYLKNGYNIGGWNGRPTSSSGVITSTPAASNTLQTTAVGYADSADGRISGQPANTIELKYTLLGDTTLTGTVGFSDFTRLTQHYNASGMSWDEGDLNYDGSVNLNDFTLLARTYNLNMSSQATPASAAVGAPDAGNPPAAVKPTRRNSGRGGMPWEPR